MKHLIVVRGGGEIASGIIHCLHRAGFRVLVLEQKNRLLRAAESHFLMPCTVVKLKWNA